MFNPKYTVTNTLLGNIKRIAEIVTELNSRRFPEVVKMEIARKAREISVFASTSIEGNPLPLTDVKRILKHAPEHVRDSEREVLNYNNALLELNEQIQSSSFSFDIPMIGDRQYNGITRTDYEDGNINDKFEEINNTISIESFQ